MFEDKNNVSIIEKYVDEVWKVILVLWTLSAQKQK